VKTPVHAGSFALAAVPTSAQTGECDQVVRLAPNTTYKLTGWVDGPDAYLGVTGGATADTWTSSTSYVKLSVSFTTGSSGTVTVYIHGWYGGGAVHADTIALS